MISIKYHVSFTLLWCTLTRFAAGQELSVGNAEMKATLYNVGRSRIEVLIEARTNILLPSGGLCASRDSDDTSVLLITNAFCPVISKGKPKLIIDTHVAPRYTVIKRGQLKRMFMENVRLKEIRVWELDLRYLLPVSELAIAIDQSESEAGVSLVDSDPEITRKTISFRGESNVLHMQ